MRRTRDCGSVGRVTLGLEVVSVEGYQAVTVVCTAEDDDGVSEADPATVTVSLGTEDVEVVSVADVGPSDVVEEDTSTFSTSSTGRTVYSTHSSSTMGLTPSVGTCPPPTGVPQGRRVLPDPPVVTSTRVVLDVPLFDVLTLESRATSLSEPSIPQRGSHSYGDSLVFT